MSKQLVIDTDTQERVANRLRQAGALAGLLRAAGTSNEDIDQENVVIVSDMIETLVRSVKKDTDNVFGALREATKDEPKGT